MWWKSWEFKLNRYWLHLENAARSFRFSYIGRASWRVRVNESKVVVCVCVWMRPKHHLKSKSNACTIIVSIALLCVCTIHYYVKMLTIFRIWCKMRAKESVIVYVLCTELLFNKIIYFMRSYCFLNLILCQRTRTHYLNLSTLLPSVGQCKRKWHSLQRTHTHTHRGRERGRCIHA